MILYSLFRNFKMWDMLCLKPYWIWLDVWQKKVYIYFAKKESVLWSDPQLQCNFMTVVAVLQSLRCVWLFVTLWTAARQASLSFTISQSLLKLMSIELVMPSNHLILWHPILFLPSIFLSLRVFSRESGLCIRWLKYWSFSFSITPSNEYSGLTSFRMDGLDLLAVQGTLKSLLQHHSSKASILWYSAFITVQFSCLYMTTGKTTALTIWTSLSKVMSLLYNMTHTIIYSLHMHVYNITTFILIIWNLIKEFIYGVFFLI